MNRFAHYALTAAGLALVALALTAAQPSTSQAAGPSKEVVVVNSNDDPLPVAGAVFAQQAGPWSVGIAGTVQVQPPPRAIFRDMFSKPAAETTLFTNTSSQRLVIELVTGTISGTGDTGVAILTVFTASRGYEHYFQQANGSTFHTATKIYLEPGDRLSARSSGTGCIYTFAGSYE